MDGAAGAAAYGPGFVPVHGPEDVYRSWQYAGLAQYGTAPPYYGVLSLYSPRPTAPVTPRPPIVYRNTAGLAQYGTAPPVYGLQLMPPDPPRASAAPNAAPPPPAPLAPTALPVAPPPPAPKPY